MIPPDRLSYVSVVDVVYSCRRSVDDLLIKSPGVLFAGLSTGFLHRHQADALDE
jgi:hypothetical protein